MDTKVLIQDLAKALAERKGIDKKDALAFVQSFFDVVVFSLKRDKYVKIKGLGTFKQIEVESRESMNIHTGERFEIQGHMKISFTPDSSLRDAVNKPFAHFETVALSDDVSESELDAVDDHFKALELEAVQMGEIEEVLVEKPEEIREEALAEPEATVLPVEEKIEEALPVVPEEADAVLPEEKEDLISEKEPEPLDTDNSAPAESLAASVETKNVTYAAQLPEEDDDEEDEEEKSKFSKYYILLTLFLVLASLGAGYLLGHMTQGKPEEIQVILYDTIYIEKKPTVEDTVKIETEPVIKKDETTPPLKQKEETVEKKTGAKAEPKKAEAVKKETAVKSSNHSNYPQLPGGAYWIVGTAQTYKLRAGETIRLIAERFFGSRQMAPYIIKYNGISDPDHVAEGTVLNIPKLEYKHK